MTPEEVQKIADAVLKIINHQNKIHNSIALGLMAIGGAIYVIKKKHF